MLHRYVKIKYSHDLHEKIYVLKIINYFDVYVYMYGYDKIYKYSWIKFVVFNKLITF